MRNIRPDASDEAIAAVVRALAPVLAYPIIKVWKVVKRLIIFDEWRAPAAEQTLAAHAATARPVASPRGPFRLLLFRILKSRLKQIIRV